MEGTINEIVGKNSGTPLAQPSDASGLNIYGREP
jgi:hypothetical protein